MCVCVGGGGGVGGGGACVLAYVCVRVVVDRFYTALCACIRVCISAFASI